MKCQIELVQYTLPLTKPKVSRQLLLPSAGFMFFGTLQLTVSIFGPFSALSLSLSLARSLALNRSRPSQFVVW